MTDELDELERLRLENRELNEQVKQLVRTERRLSLSKQGLDRQVHRVEVLNRFAFAASGARAAREVLELAIDVLFACFPYEQAVGLLRNERGRFSAVAIRAVTGREPVVSITHDEVTLPGGQGEIVPIVVSLLAGSRDPRLAPYYEVLDAVFSAGTRPRESVPLLVLPVKTTDAQLHGLVVATRVTPVLSSLEELPSEADHPFLHLMAAHVASAIRNVALFRESQAAEQEAVRQSVEVQRLYREAKEAIGIRDEFLSIASHELRTPLTSMLLQLDTLQSAGVAVTSVHLDTLERRCRRIASLIDQLLDVSRIRSGRLELTLAEVDVTAIAREVADRFRADLERAGSMLSCELTSPAISHCDAGRIDQVIASLLANAIKFGRGKPISLSVEPRVHSIRISVRDQGIGIASDDQLRVFDRFERAVSERHFGGLGLGLYIARQIVDAHGGTIELESVVGVGSTFIVEIARAGSIR